MSKVFLGVCAAIVGFCWSAANAGTVTIDFNDLGRGDTVADQYMDHVRFSSLPGRNGFGNAMIFDTNRFSGGDRDLKGKLRNADTRRRDDLGNVVIISEDNDHRDPDDNRFGGALVMNFTSAVTFFGFDAIDINHRESITLDLFGINGTHLGTYSNGKRTVGDREYFSFLTGGVSDVVAAVIRLSGSGAVDNISFQTWADPVPVPAALPLMLTGVGGLFWARRRQKGAPRHHNA